MKSHWRFLRPEECQCLHGFSVAWTNTPGSPPLCCVQSSAQCVLLSIVNWNLHWCHEIQVSSSCFIGNSNQKGFQWRIYPSPCSPEKQLQPLSPSCPCLHSGYFQTLEIITSSFSASSLPELLSTLPNPMLLWDIWGWRVRKEASLNSLFFIYVLLSLCTVSGFTLWGADKWHLPKDGRGTDDSRVIIISRQTAQGLLQLQAHHWSRGHHKRYSCERYST